MVHPTAAACSRRGDAEILPLEGARVNRNMKSPGGAGFRWRVFANLKSRAGICPVRGIGRRRADALRIAREFKDLSAHAYVDFYWPGVIYAGLGDKDEAFRLLEKSYQEHAATMPYLAIDPFWYGMRSGPRYLDLLRRVGLPQPE